MQSHGGSLPKLKIQGSQRDGAALKAWLGRSSQGIPQCGLAIRANDVLAKGDDAALPSAWTTYSHL